MTNSEELTIPSTIALCSVFIFICCACECLYFYNLFQRSPDNEYELIERNSSDSHEEEDFISIFRQEVESLSDINNQITVVTSDAQTTNETPNIPSNTETNQQNLFMEIGRIFADTLVRFSAPNSYLTTSSTDNPPVLRDQVGL